LIKLLLLTLFFFHGYVFSQTIVSSDDMEVKIETKDRVSLILNLDKLLQNSSISSVTPNTNNVAIFNIVGNSKIQDFLKITIGFSKTSIDVKIKIISNSSYQLINENLASLYLKTQDTINVTLNNNKVIKIEPKLIQELSSDLSISEKIINLYNNDRDQLNKNKLSIDRPTDDNSSSNYELNFDLSFELFNNAISEISGLISDKKNNPSSLLRLAPIVFDSLLYNFQSKLFYESTQSSESQRVGTTISKTILINNFVDLRKGYNRLRLKPILSFGVNFVYYTKTKQIEFDDPFNYELFMNVYYYIPILDKYSAIIDGGFVLKRNKEGKHTLEDADHKISLSLGYETTKETKVLLKYVSGFNGISFVKDERMLFAFIFDLTK
jgi:hypothetical protein